MHCFLVLQQCPTCIDRLLVMAAPLQNLDAGSCRESVLFFDHQLLYWLRWEYLWNLRSCTRQGVQELFFEAVICGRGAHYVFACEYACVCVCVCVCLCAQSFNYLELGASLYVCDVTMSLLLSRMISMFLLFSSVCWVERHVLGCVWFEDGAWRWMNTYVRLNVGLPKFFCADVDVLQAATHNQSYHYLPWSFVTKSSGFWRLNMLCRR